MTQWIWTCRPGFEADLTAELEGREPRPAGPSLVSSATRPAEWPVFARAGFPVHAEVAADPGAAAAAIVDLLRGRRGAFHIQAWVPDADATNPLAPAALTLGAVAGRLIPDPLAASRVDDAEAAHRLGGTLVQLCQVAPDRVLVGALAAVDAPTLAVGGRDRSHMPGASPSRAGRKLVEAFGWIRRRPEPGELCVDLGAAPGGWSAVLLDLRARVIAVDPAQLASEVRRRRGLTHVQASAFDWGPPEPVDWLLCDMAWRPLEVGALLAKWGRRRWAATLVSNIKLPMKQRVVFVRRVLAAVAEGGWQGVRGRQLYHDREEFTLTGWRI